MDLKTDWQKILGTTFDVKVTPKAAQNRIKLEEGDASYLRVYVTTVPEDGKANAALIKLLSKELGVPKSSIQIVRGEKSRDKRISIQL